MKPTRLKKGLLTDISTVESEPEEFGRGLRRRSNKKCITDIMSSDDDHSVAKRSNLEVPPESTNYQEGLQSKRHTDPLYLIPEVNCSPRRIMKL